MSDLEILVQREITVVIRDKEYLIQRSGAGKIVLIKDEVANIVKAMNYQEQFQKYKNIAETGTLELRLGNTQLMEFLMDFVSKEFFNIVGSAMDSLINLVAIFLLTNQELMEGEKSAKLRQVVRDKVLEIKYDPDLNLADYAIILEAGIRSLDIDATIKNFISSIKSVKTLIDFGALRNQPEKTE